VQRALDGIKPASVPLDRLKDPSAKVRMDTVRAIGDARSPSYAIRLIETMNDPDAGVRGAAIPAVAVVADEPTVVQALVQTVDADPDSVRRAGAAQTLGASHTPSARFALMRASRPSEQSPLVRATAVDALARQSGATPSGAEVPADVAVTLRAAASDPNTTVRLAAARALGVLPDGESEQILKKLTQDSSAEVREAAFESLARRARTRRE
jgi:HEAT repeat protein